MSGVVRFAPIFEAREIDRWVNLKSIKGGVFNRSFSHSQRVVSASY